MALRVWLPLNGDLNNQGLSDIEFTNENTSNIVIDNNGKIGKCYKRTSKQTAGRIKSTTTMNFKGDLSICCWALVTECVGDTANGLVSMHSHVNNTGFGITVKQVSTSDYRISCSTGKGNDRTYMSYYGTSNIKGAWHHLALTYNNTTHIFQLWVDGIVEKTQSYTNVSQNDYIMLFDWSTTYNGVNYRPACLLNDVRIYDHCLSPKEVSELAKGLVLHYKLADPYLEATTNLGNKLSSSCYNGATNKYNYGTATDMYKTSGTFQGRQCEKVYMGTSGLNAYPYIYFDAFSAAGATIQTLSFDYFPTIGTTIIPYSYSGTYNWSWTTDTTSGNATNASAISIPVVMNQWNHITVTAQKYDTTNTTRGIGYIRLGAGAHTSDINNYWLFANIQIEAKDHATGYTPSSRSAATEIIDSSGYGYNGLLTAGRNIYVYKDSIKYSASTMFPLYSSATGQWASIKDAAILSKALTSCTISWWGKYKTSKSLLLTGQTTSYYLAAGNNTFYHAGVSGGTWYQDGIAKATPIYEANIWHHYAVSGINLSTWTQMLLNNYGSADSWSINGQISDFRIYSTALSAAAVKDLYDTSAEIDNKGNLFVREVAEK